MGSDLDKVVSAEEKRTFANGSKVVINLVLALIVAVALIVTSFFVLDGLRLQLADKSFWLSKGILGVATFVLMISIANITEVVVSAKDRSLNERLFAIDKHYQDVMRGYETDDLDLFLKNINKANKYSAYIGKYKRRLKHARKEETKAAIRQKLLVTPNELWESAERVKYYKVTFNQLVSGAYDVSARESAFDLNVHRAKYGAQKFGWKILTIIAFGGIVGDLIYQSLAFSTAMIVPLIFKIATIVIAIYSGICFGYFIVERTKTVAKAKLRIFSQFRARVNNKELPPETRFDVATEKDIVVEKIKAAEPAKIDNPVKQTITDTFGSGIPVKPGAFVKKLVDNAIKYEAQNLETASKTTE